MKRIMIVDDEALVRIGIKALLMWEDYGYEVVAEAANGQEAIDKIPVYEPDIILSDIKMAPVDGLELMKTCHAINPYIIFIILSNYTDFENVREAMRLGAKDYIFILTIKPDEMIQVLDRATKDWKPTYHRYDEKIFSKNIASVKSGILEEILTDHELSQRDGEKIFQGITLNVKFGREYYVMVVRIDNYKMIETGREFKRKSLLLFALENMLQEILNRHAPADVFPYRNGLFFALINIKDEIQLQHLFMQIQESVRRTLGVNLSGSISDKRDNVQTLGDAVSIALERLHTNYYKTNICFYDRALSNNNELQFDATVFSSYINQSNVFGLLEYMKKIATCILEKKIFSREIVDNRMRTMYVTFLVVTQSINSEVEVDRIVDKNGLDFRSALTQYDYFDDFYDAFQYLVQEYEKYIKGSRSSRVRREILQIKRYVQDNINETLNLRGAAEIAGMSESRFSHVFKEETGQTFGEYLSGQKMLAAAKLLNQTEMQVNEIALSIGYENSNYFSTQFKRYYGISPVEYRKQEVER